MGLVTLRSHPRKSPPRRHEDKNSQNQAQSTLSSRALGNLAGWSARAKAFDVYGVPLLLIVAGLTTAAMLLISPLGWMYYIPLLIPTFAG